MLINNKYYYKNLYNNKNIIIFNNLTFNINVYIVK